MKPKLRITIEITTSRVLTDAEAQTAAQYIVFAPQTTARLAGLGVNPNVESFTVEQEPEPQQENDP